MAAGELPGMIIGIELPIVITFQWNPQIINTTKKPHWTKLYPAGSEGPIYHYGSGEPDTMTFTMDISASRGGVSQALEQIKLLTKPVIRGWGVKRPSLAQLILGHEIRRTGFVVGVTGAYGPTFDPYSMVAQQGKVSVSFEEVKLWNF